MEENEASAQNTALKFCSTCGTEVEPGVKFCTQCGAVVENKETLSQYPLQQSTNGPYMNGETNMSPITQTAANNQYTPPNTSFVGNGFVKKKKSKKMIVIISLVLIAAICTVTGFFLNDQQSKGAATPQEAVRIFLESISKNDFDKQIAMVTPLDKNTIMENRTNIPSTDKEVKTKLLKEDHITYSKIVFRGVEPLDKDDFSDFLYEYKADMYNATGTTDNISAAVIVKLTATEEYQGKKKENYDQTYKCCKIGSRWFVVPFMS